MTLLLIVWSACEHVLMLVYALENERLEVEQQVNG